MYNVHIYCTVYARALVRKWNKRTISNKRAHAHSLRICAVTTPFGFAKAEVGIPLRGGVNVIREAGRRECVRALVRASKQPSAQMRANGERRESERELARCGLRRLTHATAAKTYAERRPAEGRSSGTPSQNFDREGPTLLGLCCAMCFDKTLYIYIFRVYTTSISAKVCWWVTATNQHTHTYNISHGVWLLFLASRMECV